MRAARHCLIATLLFPFSALAEPASAPSPGVWALLDGSACQMTFEITADHHIVRTTGTLSYTTTVAFTSEARGWVLHEQLEKDNGGVSCRGQGAPQVTEHLETDAYIELLGDTLFYYPSKSGGRHLEFERSGGQSGSSRRIRLALLSGPRLSVSVAQ